VILLYLWRYLWALHQGFGLKVFARGGVLPLLSISRHCWAGEGAI
jgi:hypothetical protein